MAITIDLRADPTAAVKGLQDTRRAADRELGAVSKRLVDTERSAAQMSARSQQHLAGIQRSMGLVTRAAAAMGVAFSVSGALRSVVQAGLEFERMQRVLVASTGSLGGAKDAMGFVTSESNRLGQSVQSLLPAFSQLSAATQGTALEGEKARALFSAFAGAAQATGLSADRAGLALTGLTQIINQNQIQLDEFRNQFAVNIPGAMQKTAEMMGRTTGQLLDDIGKQKVSVEELMLGITGGLNAIAKAAPPVGDSAEAAFTRFQNALTLLEQQVAQSGLLDFLVKLANQAALTFDLIGRVLGIRIRDSAQKVADEREAIAALIKEREKLESPSGNIILGARANQARMAQIDEELASRRQALAGHQIAVQADQIEIQNRGDQTRAAADAKSLADKLERQKAAGAKAGQTALEAAAQRAKAEEAVISAGLDRQEALIASSFDQRRQQLDAEVGRQIAEAPLQVESIEAARQSRLMALAREEAQDLEQVRLSANERLLQATLAQLDAEIKAHSGKVKDIAKFEAEKVEARAKSGAEIEKILAQTASVEQKLGKETLEEQIKNAQELVKLTESVNEQIAKQNADILKDRTEEVERQLDDQQRAYDSFADRTTERIADIFEGLLEGNINLLETFKKLFLSTIANIAAEALARPIIIPVVTSVLGGVVGALSPALGQAVLSATGLGGIGSNALGLAGVANQGMNLFGPTSAIGGALSSLTLTLDTAALSVAQLFGVNGVTQSLFDSMAGLSAQAGLTPVSGLGALAGLAGIGGGIYAATTASGIGGMTGGAIGAAGGAAALLGSLGIGTSLIPGLQPIGLALAALAPLLGSLIDSLGAEKGPRFTLGELEGLDVVVENGMLQVAGTLSSAVGKAERLPEGQSADKIQGALESGLQQAVDIMVGTINAVALDPEALLIPTQEALDIALQHALTINSASAENFAKDIAAQTLAVVTSIAVSFLGPLGDALQQVFDTNLDQQLKQLPQALTLATAQLQKLVDAVTAIEDTGQSDASNVLPQLKDQINAFRKRIIDNTVDTLNEAFTGGVEDFQEALQLAISLPQGVIELHAPLGQAQAISQAFAAVVNPTVAAIETITTAMTPLSSQMQDVRDRFVELQQEIAEGGDNIATVLPLYAEMQQAILAEANLRIQQVQAIGGTLQSIEQSLFGQLSPAEQQTQLLADIAGLEAELATQTGSEAAGTAAELAALNQQLLAMGESTDNLLMTQTAIENLEALQPLLEQQLIALGGTTDVQEAIKNIQQQSLDTLKSMEEDLYNLFLSNSQVQAALNLPVPVTVVGSQAAQTGALIGYAQGGLVHAAVEPGERYFLPPMTRGQQQTLMNWNAAIPRFGGGGIVPGVGSGDTVRALFPRGTFVMNRTASSAMSGAQGYQTGGTVSGRESKPVKPIVVNINLNGMAIRSDEDIRTLANRLERYLGRVIRGQH